MFSLKNILKKDKKEEKQIDSEGYEILDVKELSKIDIFRLKLIDFFKVKEHVMTVSVCAGSAVMVIASTVITLAVVGARKPHADIVVDADMPSMQEETIQKPVAMSLYLEAVADENTITAKVYGEDGEVLTGHELIFNLLKGSKEENTAQIDKLKNAYAGQSVEGVETQAYEDDDKDGTVLMPDLETGTYTLVVQAEEGYKTPDAAEATVETFAVMENIMEKVVTDTAVTQKEDPSKNRNNAGTSEVIKPVSYVDNAVSGSVSVSSVKKSGDNIIYSIKSTKKQNISDADISKYKAGTILVEENGTNNQYSGYVYETGTVNVTGGSENVVTKFIVKSNDNNETTQAAKETQTADNNKETESSKAEKETSTENSTEIKTASYIVMEVEAQIEYIYADGWQNIKGKNYYFENSQAVTGWKNIDGVQYYFNADGSQGSSLVIDVSTYNGDIDWYKVKASGINYAMIRVGYRGYETARLVLDKRFHNNMSQATAAGVKVGAYIVTQAVNTAEAVEEASFIVSACRGYNVSLPLAIDVESAGNGSGRGDKISSSERTAVINAFAQTVNSSGYTAMLYANKDWMNNRIYAGNVGCSVWLAQYRSSCTYTGPFAMWQFTDKARVNGISGDVDMSAWKH